MKLAIIIPCYNEQEVLPITLPIMLDIVEKLKKEVSSCATDILFVDDGSKDTTWQLITNYAQKHQCVKGIKLSHNSGQQNALLAGLEFCVNDYDATVTIDADLQDDENAIIDMAKQIKEGKDIVYGIRKERKTDTIFKKSTALAFYRIMKHVDKESISNHADFRMMTKRTVKSLLQYGERNLYLRGIVRTLGYVEGFVFYDRKARLAGSTKYTFLKMCRLSIDAITSFSIAPLKWITTAGIVMTMVSIIMIFYALYAHITGKTIQGWTSLLVSLWFIGGIVTTSIGVTGIYIGKIYTETKHRPRYFIQDKI